MSITLEHAARIAAHAADYAAKYNDQEIGDYTAALAMLGYAWAATGENHLPSRRKVRRAVTKAARELAAEAATWTDADEEAETMSLLFIGTYLAAKAAKVSTKVWSNVERQILKSLVWEPGSPMQETWQHMAAVVPVHVPEPKWRRYHWYRSHGSLRQRVRVEP